MDVCSAERRGAWPDSLHRQLPAVPPRLDAICRQVQLLDPRFSLTNCLLPPCCSLSKCRVANLVSLAWSQLWTRKKETTVIKV